LLELKLAHFSTEDFHKNFTTAPENFDLRMLISTWKAAVTTLPVNVNDTKQQFDYLLVEDVTEVFFSGVITLA
jgi:hypothetical protein